MSASRVKRERRREAIEHRRTVWSDEEFGLRLDTLTNGRVRVQWTLDDEPAISLMALPRFRALLDELEREMVLDARVLGASWDDLGLFLGVTGEAVRRRHQAHEADYRRALREDQ